MKKLLFIAALMAASVGAFAQGTVNFATLVPASAIDAKATFNGTAIGNTFLGQLYAGASEGSLSPVGSAVAFKLGYIIGGGTVDTGLPVAGGGYLQVRAWDATASSYEAALAGGKAVGFSNTIHLTALGGPNPPNPPATPANLVGLQAFTVSVIPEPSTIALGALGALSLLAFRRK